ncbi:gamma-glutamylcyclotransferase family protein [Paraburkholderia bonniea]|uniref:gamma-glutamylcyclotransferase family protein n=1 Tax=Paraburkholderia bonniea TaxID=2152891 RepID=UPI0031B629C1
MLLLLLFAGLSSIAQAQTYWGKPLPNQPDNFIFGYGSLINSASRNATASKPIAAIPVRVSTAFGYIRSWNDRSPSGFTALGLRRPLPGEQAMTINGVLYPVEGNDMAAFDAREKGYVRVEVPRHDIEAISWQRLPERGRIWVYIPDMAGQEPGTGLPSADARYPLLESYVDVVVEGGLEFGEAYARELIETTQGWSAFWLNDRLRARRPWVADKDYQAVDTLLAEHVPTFAKRMFSEDYAAKNLLPIEERNGLR